MKYLKECKKSFDEIFELRMSIDYITTEDQTNIAIRNIVVSYLDNLDELINILERNRFTLFNDACRSVLECYLIIGTLIRKPKAIDILKNKHDFEEVKLKKIGLTNKAISDASRKLIESQIIELNDRILKRDAPKSMTYREMSKYANFDGLQGDKIYSLYKFFSKDTHISIFTESKKRLIENRTFSFKTIKQNTTGLTNLFYIALISNVLYMDLQEYFYT